MKPKRDDSENEYFLERLKFNEKCYGNPFNPFTLEQVERARKKLYGRSLIPAEYKKQKK